MLHGTLSNQTKNLNDICPIWSVHVLDPRIKLNDKRREYMEELNKFQVSEDKLSRGLKISCKLS